MAMRPVEVIVPGLEGIKPVELNFILPTFKPTNLSLTLCP